MPKATLPGGYLNDIDECYIIMNGTTIYMDILPEISDSKGATFPEEPMIGRSTPLKTYSHSETRSISWTAYFMILSDGDAEENIQAIRAIESCVYSDVGGSTPYIPPPVCQIKCGNLLADDPLCCVLKHYSVRFPTDVAWDETTLLPYKFSVDMQFDIVYDSTELPGASLILQTGGSALDGF